jgi:hypothetical protein
MNQVKLFLFNDRSFIDAIVLRCFINKDAIIFLVQCLLKNQEKYSEEELKEKKIKLTKFVPLNDLNLDEMIGIICETGYLQELSPIMLFLWLVIKLSWKMSCF